MFFVTPVAYTYNIKLIKVSLVCKTLNVLHDSGVNVSSKCFSLSVITAICYVLYDKRFGLLEESISQEAMDFITAIKTVN